MRALIILLFPRQNLNMIINLNTKNGWKAK